jgi:CBS domain containing-hemolysin-like protein
VPRARLAELVEEGGRAARHLLRLRDNQEALVSTIEVSISLLATAAAVIGGVSVTGALAPYLVRFPGIGPYTEKVALVLVVLLVSFLSPRALRARAEVARAARRGAVRAVRRDARLVARAHPASVRGHVDLVLERHPAARSAIAPRSSRRGSLPRRSSRWSRKAATTGTVDPEVGEIASRALDLSKLDAYTVMVPAPTSR